MASTPKVYQKCRPLIRLSISGITGGGGAGLAAAAEETVFFAVAFLLEELLAVFDFRDLPDCFAIFRDGIDENIVFKETC